MDDKERKRMQNKLNGFGEQRENNQFSSSKSDRMMSHIEKFENSLSPFLLVVWRFYRFMNPKPNGIRRVLKGAVILGIMMMGSFNESLTIFSLILLLCYFIGASWYKSAYNTMVDEAFDQ